MDLPASDLIFVSMISPMRNTLHCSLLLEHQSAGLCVRWAISPSTNLLENIMKRLKKRTRVVGVFPSRAGCERLVGARLIELHEGWQTEAKAYFNVEGVVVGA